MQIQAIWPFLLPGVLIQLLMQGICIAKSVLRNWGFKMFKK